LKQAQKKDMSRVACKGFADDEIKDGDSSREASQIVVTLASLISRFLGITEEKE
jgi:hypothetical protein